MDLRLRRRWVAWGGIGILGALVLGYALRPAPVLVDVAVLARGTLEVTVDDDGETQVKDVFTVSAPVSGHMLRIDSKVGDRVEAGKTVLAVMQPTYPGFLDARSRKQAEAEVKAAEAALTLAEAERDKAQAELTYARAEFERARELARKGNISASARDRAEMEANSRAAALNTAVANVSVRAFALETARARLIEPGTVTDTGGSCCIRIRAPVSGQVLRLLQESEQVVDAGTPLIELGDPVDLEVKVDLLSSDAVKVKAGDAVIIAGWGGPGNLKGRVRRVEPSGFTKVSALGIEEQRVNVIIDFAGDAADRAGLAHGYRVDAKIIIWQGTDVLTIPLGALFRDRNEWAAFTVVDGRARLTRVKIGHTGAFDAEVLGGLQAGATVILHPSDRVEDGVAVVGRNSR